MNEYGGPGRGPLQPVDPMKPADPLNQVEQTVAPGDPVDPVAPGNPMSPVNPADPMEPRVPVVREKPMRTWLWPTLLVFGFVIGVALVVMLVVSSADFGDEPARVTPTPESCHPFCTNTGAPPAP